MGVWSRRKGSPVDELTVGAAATAVLAAALVVWQAATSRWIDIGGHCGYDGVQYCKMANGKLAAPPYNRRPLAPLAVRLLHFGSVLDRFLVVDVIAIGGAATLVFVLTRRLALGFGADPQRSNAAAVIAASLVVLNPWVWHAAMTYPALTDPLSLALGLGWLVALTGTRPWLSVPLAAATVLCREAWAPPMLLALVACWFLLSARRPVWATNAAVVIAGSVTALKMPRIPGSQTRSFTAVATSQLRVHFTTMRGFAKFSWMAAAGLGFVALLAVVLLPLFIRRAAGARSLTSVVIALAAGHITMGVLGGTDMDRLMVPAAALLTALALGAVARVRVTDSALAFAVLASLAVWQPWRRVSAKPAAWLKTFGVHKISWVDMRAKMFADVRLLALVAIAAAIAAIATLPSRRSSAMPSAKPKATPGTP